METEKICAKPTFKADNSDRLFALLFYAVAYFYILVQLDWRWGYAGTWKGEWFVTVFVAVYAACVLFYARSKGTAVTSSGLFWLAVLMCIGISYSVMPNDILAGYQGIALHITAAYFTLLVCNGTLLPHTSHFIVFDLFNALLIVPIANIFSRLRVIFSMHRLSDKRRAAGVLLGIITLVLACMLIIPLLSQADSSFDMLMQSIINTNAFKMNDTLLKIIFSLPVGAYLFGLAFGSLNKRGTNAFSAKMLENTAESRHIIPQNTIYIVLGGVAALYVLFIAVQSGNLFSAFAGRLYGTQVYSEYAREGFFSLCYVSVINAAMLFAADLFAKSPRSQSRVLRLFNIIISSLTLLLLASALAKMLMYIGVYGFTQKRIMTLWLMAVLAVLFAGIILWQFVRFSPIRAAACTGAVLFCVLTMCGIDNLVNNYNNSLPQHETSYAENYNAENSY